MLTKLGKIQGVLTALEDQGERVLERVLGGWLRRSLIIGKIWDIVATMVANFAAGTGLAAMPA